MESMTIRLETQGELDKYPAKAHARRVAHKLKQNSGLIVLVGSKSAFYSHSDIPIRFRQDRYFYYLSGCDEPDCVLTYNIAKDWLTLYLPEISWKRFYYDGRGSTIEEAEQAYDIDAARYYQPGEGTEVFLQVVKTSPSVHAYLLNSEQGRDSVDAFSKPVDFESLRPAADACRAVKDEHEIELIKKANQITAAAHKDVLKKLHRCSSEAEVEAIYLSRCVASLAKEQAYEPIVAAGENASFLHYIRDDKQFGDSQLLLIDAGCEWQRYASDVTRTMPLNKRNPGHWPSTEAKQIYEAVERIQEQCISHMATGNKFSDVNRVAQELVVTELLDLGILKGDADDILRAGTHRAFLPHGLGHHMGLEVHDPPPPMGKKGEQSSSFFTFSQVSDETSTTQTVNSEEPYMERGNVITVEPGIYFNKFVLDRFFLPDEKHSQYIDKDVLKRYMPVGGVRIEDDVLISDYGSINLTTAPKGEEMLQIIREAAARDTEH